MKLKEGWSVLSDDEGKRNSGSCGCTFKVSVKGFENGHDYFYEARKSCPVLYDLLIPEIILNEHMLMARAPLDSAAYVSVPRLAFHNGNLEEFCSPYHIFLCRDSQIDPCLTTQYKKDLQETWILKNSESERYKQSRRFQSRWMELRVAQLMEELGWSDLKLEALGGPYDLSGIDPEGRKNNVEIKYLAQQEALFELNHEALNNEKGVSVGFLDVYSPVDYLLLRAANAAKQLRDSTERRIICLVVEDYHVSLNLPLSDNPPWIDWTCPQLMEKSSELSPLLLKERKKNSNFDLELIADITSLDEIWVLAPANDFGLECKHVFFPKRS